MNKTIHTFSCFSSFCTNYINLPVHIWSLHGTQALLNNFKLLWLWCFVFNSLICHIMFSQLRVKGCPLLCAFTVYVFRQKDSKYAFKTEIRSCLEHSSRPTSTLWVNMMARGGQVGSSLISTYYSFYNSLLSTY